jgi:hypothetical protein
MLDGDEIKQILYSVIEDEEGREKIQTEITSDIKLSRKYIELIMSKCIAKLDSESNDDERNIIPKPYDGVRFSHLC